MASTLQDFIIESLYDPWAETEHKGYVYLTPKQKGRYGELYVKDFMIKMMCTVSDPPTSTAGHDWVIDNKKTEVKFSLACRKNGVIKDDSFVINHVSVGKDWERLIFCGINTDGPVIFFITKEGFKQELQQKDSVFNYQQGGKEIANDDYMCTDITTLMSRDYVKPITEW